MIEKIREIIQSYATAINPTKEQKMVAEQRLKVCLTCEHWQENPVGRCKLCGCLTKAKVFSPEGPNACPEKKWPI